MKAYSLKISVPKIAYSINLGILSTRKNSKSKNTDDFIENRDYRAEQRMLLDWETNKVQAMNMIQSWYI